MQPPPLDSDSPCINMCVLDADRVCLGCGRHIDDIANWSRMTQGERDDANARAAQRRYDRSE